MKPLLVGEDNPYGSDSEFALYPSPVGCAGWRLCTMILGLAEGDYLERFDRVNLCPSRWDKAYAEARAEEIMASDRLVIVLFGAKVREAFGVDRSAVFSTIARSQPVIGRRFVVLPHPSGRCTIWNDPAAVRKARELLHVEGALP